MKIVIEILEGDGYDFIVEQLQWMERDRRAEGGYLTLDGNNYAMPVRIVGTLWDRTGHVIEDDAEGIAQIIPLADA